ncbi:MAG: hypothetical protein GXP03_01565 [Alphaproteobacteria bacterium]|nr:hypothetical protein [Alphaproteobacteria bacterium]
MRRQEKNQLIVTLGTILGAGALAALGEFSAASILGILSIVDILFHFLDRKSKNLKNIKPDNHNLGLVAVPGARIARVLKFLLPKKAYEEIFAQAIADMREEYFEALAANNPRRAKWIRFRDGVNLFLVIGLYLTATFVDRGMNIYKSFGSN